MGAGCQRGPSTFYGEPIYIHSADPKPAHFHAIYAEHEALRHAGARIEHR